MTQAIRSSPPSLAEFIARWQNATLTERAAAQSHFIELCRVLGQPEPVQSDTSGSIYTFEKGVEKSSGGHGFADVWFRGHFAWEYKRRGADLRDAYRQLQLYREDLENPPLLVVCDLNRFEVHTNFTGTASKIYSFDLERLADPAPLPGSDLSALDVLRALFTEPERLKPEQTAARVTEQAAAEFARLAERLRERGVEAERAAHFLMRLLFCLFAEDIDLLPSGLFTRLVENTQERPEHFESRTRALFRAMADGGFFGADDIAHFNGGLFAGDDVIPLQRADLAVLLRACRLDWAAIEPAIFGTLFERSLDPAKRSQLGAHYTSREDILLIVEPVLMAPLRREWAKIQGQCRETFDDRRITLATKQTRIGNLLQGFSARIAAVRVLDPACGSGNFLYVALKRLLDLEKGVSVFGTQYGVPMGLVQVHPKQLYGLEVNTYAHELAQVSVWIGYIQWLRDNGFQYREDPILQRLDNIKEQDAILAFDAEGKPVEPPWPEADVIIGNPPFVGDRKMRRELGDAYVDTLRRLYRQQLPPSADLVCYWFERAREQIAFGMARRAGLLATNSIRGRSNRSVLQRIKETGNIFMAWSDRAWILDGAAVRVSMVGFDAGTEELRLLDGEAVAVINADLTASSDLAGAARLRENSGLSFIGTQKSGPFDLSRSQAEEMLGAVGNPNGRPNSDVVKPWINALDVTRRPRNRWIIDFGTTTTLAEAAQYEVPFEYVSKHVKPVRDIVRRRAHKERWWLFGDSRPGMRRAIAPLSRFIVTPLVSKHRVFAWCDTRVIPENLLITVARNDDYFFGVLHSKPHELWALRMGTNLGVGNDPRYTPSTTFETFPFPWPPGKEPLDDPRAEAIAEAARELVAKRDAWLNPPDASEAELKKRTLTTLYNARPTWLDLAHRKLDAAVFAAYGWEDNPSDEEILQRLLALNRERAAR